MVTLAEELREWTARSRERLRNVALKPRFEQIGRVVRVGDGVANVAGLPQTRLDELLVFEGGVRGLAVDLGEDSIGCILLGDTASIPAGSIVHGSGEVARVPVGDALLGRVVDPLGVPLDGRGPLEATELAPIEQPAPAIVDRALVTRPLATGLLVIDAMIPLGRGQRELVIGDRCTGKTAIAVDAIINQRDSDVICVYAAVGQKASSVARAIDAVRRHGAPERCLFVIGEADAAPGVQWLTPYAACSMAEYFMRRGRDALLVIDDLSKHAAAYRQVSLLLRRPPGREAYPGDIFYIHSRLLERAAKLAPHCGGGSLTALPIAETQAGNISAYIPTNLISITDGQIYLDPRLFYEDQKPAVDVGRSVSRVGGKTQAPVLKALSESLRLEYAQFLELEVFTRFGTMVDERTRRRIEHGRRIRAVLTQQQFDPLPLGTQVALLCALADGVLDAVPLERIEAFRAALTGWLGEHSPEITALDDAAPALDADQRERLKNTLTTLAREIREADASAPQGTPP
jgi:F-type H+/Na+-transporting ATPase subunit alpha